MAIFEVFEVQTLKIEVKSIVLIETCRWAHKDRQT
jgi:hypothetical protein